MRKLTVPRHEKISFARLDELFDENKLGNTKRSDILILMTKDQADRLEFLQNAFGSSRLDPFMVYNGCKVEVYA